MAGNNDLPPPRQRGLEERIGAREQRKLRARRSRDRTVFHGLGAAGIVGWSVAVPTVLGALLGIWLDRAWPSDISWTLALLLGGVALGCLNAWYWVSLESRSIEKDEQGDGS